MRRVPVRAALIAILSLILLGIMLASWQVRTYGCWMRSAADYRPLAELKLRVAPAEAKELVGSLRTFAERHRFLFAVDYYAAGAAGIPYESYATETFGCGEIGIITTGIALNDDDRTVTSVVITKAPELRDARSRELYQALKIHLQRRFRVLSEEVGGAP